MYNGECTHNHQRDSWRMQLIAVVFHFVTATRYPPYTHPKTPHTHSTTPGKCSRPAPSPGAGLRGLVCNAFVACCRLAHSIVVGPCCSRLRECQCMCWSHAVLQAPLEVAGHQQTVPDAKTVCFRLDDVSLSRRVHDAIGVRVCVDCWAPEGPSIHVHCL